MGLREKRALHELQTVVVPKYQAELDALLGFHVELNVDLDSTRENEDVLRGLTRHNEGESFAVLLQTIKDIVFDDIGKNAVKSAVQSLVLVNYNQSDSDIGGRKVVLHNGRLELHCGWGSYSSEIETITICRKQLKTYCNRKKLYYITM